MIGEVPNAEAGQNYSTCRLAHEAGVHRPLQAGIRSTKRTGAESIVVSGGYKDDEDHGGVIIYTGHGGQDGAGNQVSDQALDDSGNAALVTSCLEGLPVRVLRGWQSDSSYVSETGYRYDGLYRVTSYGSKLGIDGFLIWQFRLEAYDYILMPQSAQQLPAATSTEPTTTSGALGAEGKRGAGSRYRGWLCSTSCVVVPSCREAVQRRSAHPGARLAPQRPRRHR
ncbi:YDG/SRA domain-containing protein [Streptomyces collinus]|uniref:YDG/SRA domain-containing protein n=1 Tax=Streptomyces collinus TaxID=42684 RepID=UPI0033D3C857